MLVVKQFFDVVVVMPIGPGCVPEFISDSISSFLHYSRYDHKIILIDDSQKGTGLRIKEQFPQIDVLTTAKPMGKLCGLYITLCTAFRHALQHYRFRALLRMDSDALIIGSAPEAEALDLFKHDPGIGIAGQYPGDYKGSPWDISWPKEQVLRITQTRRFFDNPFAHWLLLRLYKQALRNGYTTGESVFGGACFISEACLKQMDKNGLLPKTGLRTIHLEEDHLFAILARAVGFRLGDLSSQHLPFGCAWKGLPASPEELHAKGKKIIHSTRFWEQMNEQDIREWFRSKRTMSNNN
jgi:predicted metal-binding protein